MRKRVYPLSNAVHVVVKFYVNWSLVKSHLIANQNTSSYFYSQYHKTNDTKNNFVDFFRQNYTEGSLKTKQLKCLTEHDTIGYKVKYSAAFTIPLIPTTILGK